MHLLTIIWTLICAAIIVGYPMYLLNKSTDTRDKTNAHFFFEASNAVELISFDLQNQLPGWSLNLDVPQITEEVLYNNPILFYLELEDSYTKLPTKNSELGYKANIYKNVGKVYITFKSLADEVSNFYVPAWHLSKLKILIIKPHGNGITTKHEVYKKLQRARVNIENYDDVLGHLSNVAQINFKGHFPINKTDLPRKQVKQSRYSKTPQYFSVG
ncbi:MAG: hypothetical protein AB3N18_05085 [Allomuricauda sp.]